jgi:ketosteroid isomerase-like protein
LKTLRAEHSDDLAYDSGDFEETVTSVSNGKQYQVKGNYLMVFRRAPGGKWLIVEQVMTDREQPAH